MFQLEPECKNPVNLEPAGYDLEKITELPLDTTCIRTCRRLIWEGVVYL